jgi:hypothetical protein
MDKCSINSKYENTCMSLKTLKELANKINKEEKYKNIKNIKVNQYNEKNKKKLLKNIKKKLSCDTNIDLCVLKKENEFYNILKNDFKPKGPIDKDKWLSSLDIINVMEHYEKKYKNFEFLGPFPIDFYFVYKDFRKRNFKKMFKNKKKIGIIFNTDVSTGNGEHWITLYIDLEEKYIYFFDSVGDKPTNEIKTLINDLKKEYEKYNYNFKIEINKKEFQKDNSSCGIWALWFIISKLENGKINKKANDKLMYKKRKKFFRE